MELHQLFKIKRKALNLSQEWFAEKLNTTQPTISRAELGQSESMLNQMISLLLKEYPKDVKFTNFYPEHDPKRFDLIEGRIDKVEIGHRNLLEQMKELSKQIKDLKDHKE